MPGVKLTDVNPELVCVLCHGYFIDATAIKECLHSFCRSCIILYLETKNYCPKCQVPINTSRPHLSLKSDKTRQDIVYKLVPGLFHDEMRRRREFYSKNCHRDMHLHPEARGVDVDRLIYSPEDSISLSLEYCDSDKEKEEWGIPAGVERGLRGAAQGAPQSPSKQLDKNLCRKRYLQCPAEVSMCHLKKFIRMKYELPPLASVELFYKRESLPDDYSLMDIAYIYTWKRNGPMRFYYRIHIPTFVCKISEHSKNVSSLSSAVSDVENASLKERSPSDQEDIDLVPNSCSKTDPELESQHIDVSKTPLNTELESKVIAKSEMKSVEKIESKVGGKPDSSLDLEATIERVEPIINSVNEPVLEKESANKIVCNGLKPNETKIDKIAEPDIQEIPAPNPVEKVSEKKMSNVSNSKDEGHINSNVLNSVSKNNISKTEKEPIKSSSASSPSNIYTFVDEIAPIKNPEKLVNSKNKSITSSVKVNGMKHSNFINNLSYKSIKNVNINSADSTTEVSILPVSKPQNSITSPKDENIEKEKDSSDVCLKTNTQTNEIKETNESKCKEFSLTKIDPGKIPDVASSQVQEKSNGNCNADSTKEKSLSPYHFTDEKKINVPAIRLNGIANNSAPFKNSVSKGIMSKTSTNSAELKINDSNKKEPPKLLEANKSVAKSLKNISSDISIKKSTNGIRFDSPKVTLPSNSYPNVRKTLPNINHSARSINSTSNSNHTDTLKRKRNELERCIETENGSLSVSLLSQSQQELEAKKMKMVEPDVSIQLMSFSYDKKLDSSKTNNRIALSENSKTKDISPNESSKLCNSNKGNVSSPIQKRENSGPLDLSSQAGTAVKLSKSSTSPSEKRRKVPPLTPLRVPSFTPPTDLKKSPPSKSAVSSSIEQKDFSKLPKEAIEYIIRHQFNNNKGSEKFLDEFVRNCQNYAFSPPYPIIRPNSNNNNNNLSPETVRK